MTNSDDIKNLAQSRYSQFAQGYVESQSHAKGDDLERLLTIAAPQPGWLALDIATGGGHTALKFAPHVAQVVAADLTPNMLLSARAFIQSKGASNLIFSGADAENLPFAGGSFDLITCRIAPHHFPDCFRFVQECARALKSGGVLLVQDLLAPEDDRAARYIDSFERLRDPSHVRTYADYEWRGMYLDAGLHIAHVEHFSKARRLLLPWAERQGNTPEIITRLHILLAQAPEAVTAWMNPHYAGTPEAVFDHHYILIAGRKA